MTYDILLPGMDMLLHGKTTIISEDEFNHVRADFIHGVDPITKNNDGVSDWYHAGDKNILNDEVGYFVWYDKEKENIRLSMYSREKYLEEITRVAQKLNANLQGPRFEYYADYAEWHSPHKSNFRKVMRANLPEEFPMIDNFNPETKTVTKMEVIDLRKPPFKDIKALGIVVQRFVQHFSDIRHTVAWDGRILKWTNDFDKLEMMLGIPQDTATPDQQDTLIALQEYAKGMLVRLIIVEIP